MRQKLLSLYNPISEVTSYHFSHVLFIRSKFLGPAALQGKGLHKGVTVRDKEAGFHRSVGSQGSMHLDQGESLKISPFPLSSTALIQAFKTTFKNSFTH